MQFLVNMWVIRKYHNYKFTFNLVILFTFFWNSNGEGDEKFGYLDDSTGIEIVVKFLKPLTFFYLVPKDSITPTFALVTAYINNERWEGVSFRQIKILT